MRVTANMFPDSLVDQLSKLTSRQNRLQNQAATGQRVQRPEDDPAAVRRVLDLQSQSSVLTQYQRNIGTLKDLSNASYAAMRSLKNVSDRAGEIATLADGTKSPEELAIYATELTQLIQEAVDVANQQHRGDHLFSGTKSDQPPFVIALDANGRVTSVTYQGNTSVASSEIAANVTVSGQTVGANTSGSGPRGLITDSRSGADFFNHLISLQDHLVAGDTAAISSVDHAQLALDEDNLLYHIGNVGATLARLEATEDLNSKQLMGNQTAVSSEVDVDLADTLVRLSQTQTAYQVALQSGAQIMSRSLLDYLK